MSFSKERTIKRTVGTMMVLLLAGVGGLAQEDGLTAGEQQFASQTDEQVSFAITPGNRSKGPIGLELTDQQAAFFSAMSCSTCQVTGYRIHVYNPQQWIQHRAAQARHEMQPFGLEDVTDEMRAPVLHVRALPSEAEYITGAGLSMASSVHRVVLTNTARTVTIQPLNLQNGTTEGNSAFRSVEYTNASADFPLSEVAKLRASDPKGEFFVVVVGEKANKYFKIKARDFKVLGL